MSELTTMSLSSSIVTCNYELKAKLNPQLYFLKQKSLQFFPVE